MSKKRSKVWPLTKTEAAIVKSLDKIFWLSAGVLLAIGDKDYDGKKVDRVKKAFLEWRRGVDSHMKRFPNSGDFAREIRGAYRTLGLKRHRMRRPDR